MTRKTAVFLVLLMLLGMTAAAWQLAEKASIEPLRRQMTLVVDTFEVQSYGADSARLWAGLQANGVRAALVRSVAEAKALPAGMQSIAVVDEVNWPVWKVSGFQPNGVVFSFNTFPAPLNEVRQVFPDQPFGLFEFTFTRFFAANESDVIGNTWRIYDRQARDTNRFQNEFAISVLERQVDLTVVRLLLEESVAVNIQRATAIQSAVADGGHTIGNLPTPRPAFGQPAWVQWAITLGLGAAVALGLCYLNIGGLPSWLPLLLPPLALIGSVAAGFVLSPNLHSKLLALAAAIVYPIVGLLAWWHKAGNRRHALAKPMHAVADFLRMIIFAFIGGLSVHALLARSVFQLNLQQFAGIKFAYLIPLGVAAVLVGQAVIKDVRRNPRNYLNKARTNQAIFLAGLVFLAVVFVLLNRSGNRTIIPVSAWEMDFRDRLFKLLWARPRTKEFLGYPVLLVGLLLWQKRELLYGGLAVLVGYIGVLSMVNTFEHLHHPILLEITRSGVGLAIGLLIGLPALWLVERYAYLLKGKYRS